MNKLLKNMPGHWSVMGRRKVNQIYSANAENPQLHCNHSSLNRLVIAGTDRQMRLTKQLVKRNASHLACTVQQMNGFCWGVSPGLVDRGLKSELSSLSDRRDKDRPVYFTHSFSLGAFSQLIHWVWEEQRDRSVMLLHLCGGLSLWQHYGGR